MRISRLRKDAISIDLLHYSKASGEFPECSDGASAPGGKQLADDGVKEYQSW